LTPFAWQNPAAKTRRITIFANPADDRDSL